MNCWYAAAAIIMIMSRMPSLLSFDGRTGDKTVDKRRKTSTKLQKEKKRGKRSYERILDILYPGPKEVKLMTSSSTGRDQLLRNHYASQSRVPNTNNWIDRFGRSSV